MSYGFCQQGLKSGKSSKEIVEDRGSFLVECRTMDRETLGSIPISTIRETSPYKSYPRFVPIVKMGEIRDRYKIMDF